MAFSNRVDCLACKTKQKTQPACEKNEINEGKRENSRRKKYGFLGVIIAGLRSPDHPEQEATSAGAHNVWNAAGDKVANDAWRVACGVWLVACDVWRCEVVCGGVWWCVVV